MRKIKPQVVATGVANMAKMLRDCDMDEEHVIRLVKIKLKNNYDDAEVRSLIRQAKDVISKGDL